MAHLLVAADAAVEVRLLAWVGGHTQGAVGADLLGQVPMAAEAVRFQHLGVARA